ncbi:MAG: hypothetical protein ACE5Q6_04605, partial [Dehalococcoidia bacterium]
MFGSEILEVAIGLVLVYLLLALICSALSEWIARILAMRASTLEAGIRNLLEDPGGTRLAKKIYDHRLIGALYKKGWIHKGRPSNIPARTFALALFDTVMEAGGPAGSAPSATGADDRDQNGKSLALQNNARMTYETLETGVRLLGAPPQVKKALQSILSSAKAETDQWDQALGKARASVEDWFDDSMERVSGWYKRKAQLIILALAIIVSLAMNVDTFVIAHTLSIDTTLRESVVAAAESKAQQTPPPGTEDPSSVVADLRDELGQLALPIGWSFPEETTNEGVNN